MRQAPKAVLLTSLLYALLCTQAGAQVDLVVKLRPEASVEITTSLQALSKGLSVADASGLFEGVSAVTPVFGRRAETASKSSLSHYFVLSVADSGAYSSAMARWSSSDAAEWAIPNRRYAIDRFDDTYNDTHFDSLGHLRRIGALDAWTVTTGSSDVRMGIVDTGIFFDHPDFQGQFGTNAAEDLNGNGRLDASDLNGVDDDGNGYVDDVLGYDFVDRSEAVDPGDYRDRDPDASEDRLAFGLPNRGGLGHGTLVAGIAGAALNNNEGIAGVAPGARLVPLRAFGVDGLGEDDDVSAAIVYAAELGIDVVNLSFGDTYYSPLMADAVRYATSLGTTVVASGGNVGTDAPHYPSDYPEVIGAVWLDEDGERRGSRASFGTGIDVGAPGSFVYTTLLPPPDAGDTQIPDSVLYGYRSGSSVSAPQIAGVAALLRSLDKSLSPASIKAILTSTATDLAPPGWDHETAAGRVNAAAALGLPFPAAVAIESPGHQSGVPGRVVDVVGTVLNPLFDSYSLWYALDADGAAPSWTRFSGPHSAQVRSASLGTWNTEGLADAPYLLRLEVSLKDGRTVEDRRRVYLDRTAPLVDVVVSDAALIAGQVGIQVELETDDLTTAELVVMYEGVEYRRRSDRLARRHGRSLRWIDNAGRGGPVDYRVEVSNVAGHSVVVPTVRRDIPPRPEFGYLSRESLNTPAGFLLPKATDIDGDAVPEVVMNRYMDGWLGDTVKVLEWAGEDFRPFVELLTNSFPRDAGDIDADGNPEILLQVSAVAQVVEFTDGGSSAELVFIDTAGINNPAVDSAAWGTLLGDFDSDGRGEVIVHNRRAIRVLEWNGSRYAEVLRLTNPTPPEEADASLLGTEINGFAEPEAVLRDLDGDGLDELIVTDTDGDFIVYESTGDNLGEAVWWRQTSRFTNQGSRMTTGDFDGDGQREFVGFVHSWPDSRTDGEYEAPLGMYYFFESTGDNSFSLVDSLVVAGNLSNHGAVAAVDFDGDDVDELVIAHPPDLYVVKPDPEVRWRVLYSGEAMPSTTDESIRSISLVSGDFDGDGIPELLAAGADLRLQKFEWSSSGTSRPTPRWVRASALNEETVILAWQSNADSVAVYRAFGSDPFDLLAITARDTLVDAASDPVRYRIRGISADGISAFSAIRAVRPHAQGRVLDVAWLKDYLGVEVSEPVDDGVDLSTFALRSDQLESVLVGEGGRRLLFRFRADPVAGDTLFWATLEDREGTPFADRFVLVPQRAGSPDGLVLASWEAVSETEAVLMFNLPLEPNRARDVANYSVSPAGRVVSAVFSESQPNAVRLEVRDRSLGPSGLRTTIVVRNLLAADGSALGSEGNVATFAKSAESTAEAYIFPNPFRAEEHPHRVMIAGLPRTASIGIYSPQGEPIRFLEESDGDGGISWDLRDAAGDFVPSGVYIVLVRSDGQDTVTLKAAIMR